MPTKNNRQRNKNTTRRGGFGFKSFLPSKTLSDFSRTKDKYGEIPFLIFYSVVMSRLAYLPDQGFVKAYANIIGPIIPVSALDYISKTAASDPLSLVNDSVTYKYELNDFAKQINPMVQKIENQLINSKDNISFSTKSGSGNIKYISLASSKYGETYILTDSRCPNVIFVNFRGTYSAATAAIYSKLRTAKPVKLNKDVGVLYGIYKATCQYIHTIIESMKTLHLAQGFQKSRVITTGHSLGGGMTTIFGGLFYEAMNQPEYSNYPFHSKPICISVASPLVTDKSASNKYCNLISNQQIYFKKVITRGDPVIMIPKLGFYSHVCSHEGSKDLLLNNKPVKTSVNMVCNNNFNSVVMSSLSGIGSKMFSKKDDNAETSRVLDKATVNYDGNLDCLKEKGRKYIMNPLSHTIYLNINFITGVDLTSFASGMVSMTTKEIAYDKSITSHGESVCRIIYGEFHATNNSQDSMPTYMKIGFFKFNTFLNDTMKKIQLKERIKEEENKKNKGDTEESIPELENSPMSETIKITPQDVYMTTENFNTLLNNYTTTLAKGNFIEKGHGPKQYNTDNYKNLYDKFNRNINKSKPMSIIKCNLTNYEKSGGKRRTRKNKRTKRTRSQSRRKRR